MTYYATLPASLSSSAAPTHKDPSKEPKKESSDDLRKRFNNYRSLTAGSYGEIYVATDIQTGEDFVVKKLQKNRISAQLQQRINNEIEACQKLQGTEGIIKYHGYFESNNHIWLVLDFIKGCDLFAFMESREFSPIPEEAARKIFKTVVKALVQMHRSGIAHKDIKLENILLDKKLNATIIDLGLCSIFDIKNNEPCTDYCGSKEYCAPEILSQKPFSATKSDVWSLGVTLFAVVYGVFPFSNNAKRDAQGNVFLPIHFPTNGAKLSSSCKDLLAKMLVNDPAGRISMEQVIQHPWFKKGNRLSAIFSKGATL